MNDFFTTYISTNTTTNIQTSARAVKIHTINLPKATAGIVTFQDKDGTAYFALPAASIGTLILDAQFPNGLSVVTASADTVLVNAIKL